MSDMIFGFRPELGWAGVLFQVFLQGLSFYVPLQRQKEQLKCWIYFGGQGAPAVLHEVDSEVDMQSLGFKRWVLQCIVPERRGSSCTRPVNLSVFGDGGKTVYQSIYIGIFTYRPNGLPSNLSPKCRWIVEHV